MNRFDPIAPTNRIDLASEREFELGGLKVRPFERIVLKNGEQRELQPRVMQVLVALARSRPKVISRDMLIEQCWEGRIVGDDALNRCVLALRHLAQEFTPPPFAIETVPRVGHRLIENGRSHVERPAPRRLILAAAALIVLALAGVLIWQRTVQKASNEPASIAVLPFRSLGTDDPYFAEGIGEEILAQLAREPNFRVAGGSSSVRLAGNDDLGEVARRLKVEYLVEGAVRKQGERVRVNAHLVRADNGTRLWSDSYDGTLDDIFAIQRSIGLAIGGALRRKLVAEPPSGALVTNGKTYNLYLTARGLIRSRSRRAGPTAVDLLRDAIQIDPKFAPAWASLGEATLLAGALMDSERFVGAVAEGQGHARHALKLAPDLPEAHRVLGSLSGYGTPQAVAHLRRAASLDPNNAETMIVLGGTYGATGEFQDELAAYRRALELDPVWFRAAGSLATALAEMGERREAEAIVKRSLPPNDIEHHLVLGKVASVSGDFSEAYRRWSIVEGSKSPRWSNSAGRYRKQIALALGMSKEKAAVIPRPLDQRHLERIWMDRPPEPSIWKARNRDAFAAAVYRDENHVAAKMMLNSGRWGELVAAYDGPGGLVGIRRGVPVREDQLSEAPVAALALRRAGRNAEADDVLRQAQALVERIELRGRVPFWFDADVAALLAVGGKREAAASRLSRAFDRGWRHAGFTDLPDVAQEPTLALLRGDPRFERLQKNLRAHRARERAETATLLAYEQTK